MASKKVTWANHKGGYLEHRLDISRDGKSRSVPTRKPQRPIPSRNMARVIRDRHARMLKNIGEKLEKCQRDILELQQYCERLMKEEAVISRAIKYNVMNSWNKAILSRMAKIDKNLVNKREKIKEKKLELRQLSNKMKATKRSII